MVDGVVGGFLRSVAAGALIAATLATAACGSADPVTTYCKRVTVQSVDLGKDLDAGGRTSGLLTALPRFKDLAEVAPDDIADDWATFIAAVEGLRDALARARLQPGDMADGTFPEGLPAADRKALLEASTELDSTQVRDAAAAVEQHARDVCHQPLF